MDQLDLGAWLSTSTELVSTWGLRVVGAIAVLVLGRAAARWARKRVVSVMTAREVDATLIPFLGSLVYWLGLVFVGLAVLGLFGIPTASFIAVLGAASLAVGLALQGTLSSFAAGVMLLVFRPFRVDDVVDVGGTLGTVRSIGIFTTELDTPDNVRIIIPNSSVYGEVIKNYATNELRRIDLVMGVSYDDDLETAAQAIRRIVGADPRVVAEPVTVVELSELAGSSVNFVVRPWCRSSDYWPLRFALTRALKEGLEEAGCSFPYPQRDVHLFTEGASAPTVASAPPAT